MNNVIHCSKMPYNGTGIATVADLRASSLSAETKAQAEQRTLNYHLAPLLLAIPCYHTYLFYMNWFSILLIKPSLYSLRIR